MRLERLRLAHAAAVLHFEVENREYFAASITDRGDDYFERFSERYQQLLAEQKLGTAVFYVLTDDGKVVGRFNLYDPRNGNADVGYRVAREVAGRGVATSALRELCRLAVQDHGLRSLSAKTSNDNVASQRVLEKGGFVAVGPTDVAGRPGILYHRRLPGSDDDG